MGMKLVAHGGIWELGEVASISGTRAAAYLSLQLCGRQLESTSHVVGPPGARLSPPTGVSSPLPAAGGLDEPQNLRSRAIHGEM